MTGVFNLLFQQTVQFQSYFDSFFYLAQAAQQEYELGERWNQFLNFSLIIYMGVCTLVLINLIIAHATRIYDEADDDVTPEHRSNLVKLYEYLRWDENYGLFKFLFAPFNVIQLPFSIFILFPEDKKYWTEIFTRVLFFPIAVLFFILFLVYNSIKAPIALFHLLVIQPFKYGTTPKKLLMHLIFGPFIFILYYFRDMGNFWEYAYAPPFESNDEKEDSSTQEIIEFRKTFATLIDVVSNRVENDKKCKRFYIPELLSSWLTVITQNVKNVSKIEIQNRMHRKLLIARKYKNLSIKHGVDVFNRKPHVDIFQSPETETISIYEQFRKNFDFLYRFADKDGFIDKDIAKNLFPKQNYYDDDYFECIFYYSFKYFKGIMTYFTKMTNEIKKDMNKLRGVYMDFLKINEKFKNLKIYLKTYKFTNEEINTLVFGITNINTVFAGLENHLNDAQAKELYEKISKQSSSNAHRQAQTSSLQNNQIGQKKDDGDKGNIQNYSLTDKIGK
jgi:hypothetical protein